MQTNAARIPAKGPRYHIERFQSWKIASPLRHARRAAALSVADCAQLIGSPATTYRRWQDGETAPPAAAWPRIQALFKTPSIETQYATWMKRRPRP